jgi:hypothetical protein
MPSYFPPASAIERSYNTIPMLGIEIVLQKIDGLEGALRSSSLLQMKSWLSRDDGPIAMLSITSLEGFEPTTKPGVGHGGDTFGTGHFDHNSNDAAGDRLG